MPSDKKRKIENVYQGRQSIKSLFVIFIGFETIHAKTITFENNLKMSHMTEIMDLTHGKSFMKINS